MQQPDFAWGLSHGTLERRSRGTRITRGHQPTRLFVQHPGVLREQGFGFKQRPIRFGSATFGQRTLTRCHQLEYTLLAISSGGQR
jgi:hypothetical protein